MSETPISDPVQVDLVAALRWLHERFPVARISSELIPGDAASALVRVTVDVENGASASGHGFAMTPEEAEDRAITRAITHLGFDSRRTREQSDESPVSGDDAVPVGNEPAGSETRDDVPTVAATPVVELSRPDLPEPARPPTPAPLAGKSGQMGPPVMVRTRQSPAGRPPAPHGGLRAVPDQPTDEPRLEDVSWTEFWKWARPRGFDSRDAVVEAIGEPIEGMTPREVREALIRALDQ